MFEYLFSEKKKALFFGVISIVLCYIPFLTAPFYFDDLYNIADNPYLVSVGSALKCKLGGFRPLAYLSFYADKVLFGLNPVLMRIENIGFHIVNYFLVYLLIKKTLAFSELNSKDAFFVSYFSALLWALNPVNSQSVGYIVQRMNVLSSLFILLGLITFLDFIKTRKVRFAFLYAFLFFVSVGFKETGLLLLPLSLLVYIVFVDLKKGLLAAFFGIFVFLVLLFNTSYFQNLLPLEYLSGNPVPDKGFTFFQRLITEPKIVLDYLITFFLPLSKNIHLYYSVELEKTFFSIKVLLPLAFLFAFFSFGIYSYFKKRKVCAFFVFAFLISLFPESFLIPLDLAYLHRMYLPSVFLLPLVLIIFYKKVEFGFFQNFIAFFVLFFGINLFARGFVFSSPAKFYLNELKFAPENPKVYVNASRFFLDRNNLSEARVFLEKGLNLFPDNVDLQINNALFYAKKGERDKAIRLLQTIGNVSNKRKGEVSFLLAVLYLGEKDFAKAKQEIEILKRMNYRKDKIIKLQLLLKKVKEVYSADTMVE